MAKKRNNEFLLKRSSVPGKIPSPGDLKIGELALNVADGKIFVSGLTSNSIIPIGWDRLSLSGGTVSGDVTANNFIGDGSQISNIFEPKKIIYITLPSQLSGVLSSDVNYVITKEIVLTSPIIVPEQGLTISGYSPKISVIKSTIDNFDLFVNTSGSLSGALRFNKLTFNVSGTNSKVFNLDNQGTSDNENNNIDFTDINFINCTSVGVLKSYRQLFWSIGSMIVCSDGLRFDGVWSGGVKIVNNRSIQFSGVLFKAGPSFTLGSRFLCDANITIGANSKVSDFSPSNILHDANFHWANANFDGGITFADYFTNIDQTNVKSLFTDCVGNGIKNTHIGITCKTVLPVITTVISSPNTYFDLLFNSTFFDVEHFSSSSNINFNYLSTISRDFILFGSIVIDGGPNDEISIRVLITNTNTSTTRIAGTFLKRISNSVGGNDVAQFVIYDRFTLSEFESVKLQVANTTDTTNIRILNDSTINIKRR